MTNDGKGVSGQGALRPIGFWKRLGYALENLAGGEREEDRLWWALADVRERLERIEAQIEIGGASSTNPR